MAIDILEFLNGDTDYISKHNTNNTNIKSAIDALQSAIGSGGGSSADSTVAVFYEGLMGGTDTVIGVGSFAPDNSGTLHEVEVAPGTAYHESTDAVVIKETASTINLLGQTSGTYYVHVDPVGEPYYDQITEGSLYSFDYDAPSGLIDEVATTGGILYSTDDMAEERSNLWDVPYNTTDDRIDAAEKAALYVLRKTSAGSDLTLTDQEAFEQTVLMLEDGPQTADIDITVPAQERVYTIINNGSSVYSATIMPEGGTGYEIPGGSFAIVHVTATEVTPIFLMDRTQGASPTTTFITLTDAPSSYVGQDGKIVEVNEAGNRVQFADNVMRGPAVAVDGTLPVFDTTTGKLVRDSGFAIDDTGTGATTLWSAEKITAQIGTGGGGGVALYVQATEPVDAPTGAIWIETV